MNAVQVRASIDRIRAADMAAADNPSHFDLREFHLVM